MQAVLADAVKALPCKWKDIDEKASVISGGFFILFNGYALVFCFGGEGENGDSPY